MNVAAYYAPNDIRIEERPVPDVGPDELLVQVTACGLCGTDVHKYLHRTVPEGTVLGHEVVGRVAQVGARVRDLAPGQRVVVFHHIPCFVCDYCRRGHHSMCAAFKPVNISPGGFAQYLRVSSRSVAHGVLKVPDHVTDRAAAVVELAACCLRADLRCGLQAGNRAAVIGCGPVGLVHIQLLAALGAGPVAGIDVIPERLEAARRAGAHAAVNPAEGDVASRVADALGGMPQVVILAAGNARAIATALDVADKGGLISFFAECPSGSEFLLDPNLLYHKELTLAGSYSSSPFDQRMALELVSAGRVRFGELVTDELPLRDVQKAFDLAVAPGRSLKIIVKPNANGGDSLAGS